MCLDIRILVGTVTCTEAEQKMLSLSLMSGWPEPVLSYPEFDEKLKDKRSKTNAFLYQKKKKKNQPPCKLSRLHVHSHNKSVLILAARETLLSDAGAHQGLVHFSSSRCNPN